MKLLSSECYDHFDISLPDRILKWNESEKTAIVCEGREISYKQMNKAADTVAFYLMERGVKKGDIVALDMRRSERFICAFYGVMRSGGCCLPMEHTWPEARKQAILKTTGATFCIRDEDYAAMLSEGYRTPEPRITCEPEDNAVVLFTSGSTGVPKGIFINHKRLSFVLGVAFYRQRMEPRLEAIKKSPAYVTFSTLMGVVMFTEVHSLGQTAFLLNEEESKSPSAVGQAILNHGLQDLFVSPAFLRAGLQDQVFRSAMAQLKDFRVIGGALTQDMLREMRNIRPDLAIWNAYGMTELGFIAAGYAKDDPRNVGKPVPGVLVVILDENGRNVGVNEPGEICVSTRAITTSYMNAPELNRQKHFVHPEYGPLFRTGDLGQADEEGHLYHLGRIDRMVKIRDVRIELDEVGQAIASFPGIKQGIAAAHGLHGDRFIVGYYLSDVAVDDGELRCHMQKLLPQSFIPRFLMRLDQIPMTDTNKIAYAQLPVPTAWDGIVYEAPETAQERCLSQVVGEVLQLPAEQVSMEAGFARLGGDSIRAMIVCSRLREQGWGFQPNMLYSEPSLRQAAQLLKPVKEDATAGCLHADAEIRGLSEADLLRFGQAAGGENNIEAVLRLSPENRFFYKRLKVEPGVDEYNIISLQLFPVSFTEETFRDRVRAVVRCHPALRSLIVETDLGDVRQVVLREREPSCYYRDLRYLADGDKLPTDKQRAFCNMYLNFHKSAHRTPEEALVSHFVCFRLGDDLCAVGFDCCHVFMDGWSSGVLRAELAGTENPVAQDHYIDYMLLRNSRSISADLRFWREYLKDVTTDRQILPMKQEWSKGAMQSCRLALGEALSKRLEQYAKEKYISPTVILQYLTGWIVCEMLEKSELVLMICFASRGADVPGEERIVGNLMRIYPIRFKAGESLERFHADLRLAEQHAVPSIDQIFVACGLWVHPVRLSFTTTSLPGIDPTKIEELYKPTDANASPDTFLSFVATPPGRYGAQFEYNPLIFPKEKMEKAEARLQALARRLLEEAGK